MKKITVIFSIAFLIILQLCIPCLVANAETGVPVNTNVDFGYVKIAPKIDGKVNLNEYGKKVHSVDYLNKEFLSAYDKDKSIKADFYAAWDTEFLYLSWIVYTDIHKAIEGYDSWSACGVQFQLTPKDPTQGLSGYLETAICATENNAKYQYCIPNGAKLTLDDWDFVGYRDKKNNTTSYEVKIPFDKLGITGVGNGKVIGMSYAIGDQLGFKDNDVSTQNMCEWQDCMLGGKTPSNCAVVTLKGGDKDTEDETSYAIESFDPADKNDEILTVNHVNGMINTDQATILTDENMIDSCNLIYTMNVVLAPTNKKYVYKVCMDPIEAKGAKPDFDLSGNKIIIAFHGDTPGNKAAELKELAGSLNIGDILTFQGFNFEGSILDENAYILITRTENPDESDTSKQEISSESNAAESDKSISNDSATIDTSNDNDMSVNKSGYSTSEPKEDKDNNTWLIISILIITVITISTVTYVIIKKRKNR